MRWHVRFSNDWGNPDPASRFPPIQIVKDALQAAFLLSTAVCRKSIKDRIGGNRFVDLVPLIVIRRPRCQRFTKGLVGCNRTTAAGLGFPGCFTTGGRVHFICPAAASDEFSAAMAAARSNRTMRPALIVSGMIPALHQFLTHCGLTPTKLAKVAGLSSGCAGFALFGVVCCTPLKIVSFRKLAK